MKKHGFKKINHSFKEIQKGFAKYMTHLKLAKLVGTVVFGTKGNARWLSLEGR